MITVKPVVTKKEQKAFLEFPLRLYAGNPCFVPPLYMDEKKIFRADYVYNDCCDSVCFLAWKDGAVAGRIQAIIQKAANEKNGERRARFTRFDVIDDFEVSRALFGAAHGISGIDTAEADKVRLDRREALKELSDLMIRFSRQQGAAVLISGETDLVTDGEGLWAVENGVAEMGLVTGTGCMLSCVSALTLSAFGREGAGKAALLAAGIMGLAGEEAKRAVLKGLAAGTGETKGPLPLGAFHMGLLDAFSTLTPEKFREGARIQRII